MTLWRYANLFIIIIIIITQFPGNEKITLCNTKKYKNQAAMNLTGGYYYYAASHAQMQRVQRSGLLLSLQCGLCVCRLVITVSPTKRLKLIDMPFG